MYEDKNQHENYEPNFTMREAPQEIPAEGEGVDSGNSFRDPRAAFTGRTPSWGDRGKGKRPHFKKLKKFSLKPSPAVTLTRRSLSLLIAGCLALSCLFGFGSAWASDSLFGSEAGPANTGVRSSSNPGYSLESATGSKLTVKEITEKAQASIVEIKTEGVTSDSWMQQYVTEGAGSGIIISPDGYIMTNSHVIDGAGKITITTSSDKSYEAKVVGNDSDNDIAVLRINAGNLVPAVYGNSDELQVGDMAVAIGNPLGELGGTVTAGIISATDRELSIGGKTMSLLQTDSSINPGNSGGGLFNGSGQLIGIVVAKSSGSDVEGLGFAIPVNKAANVAQQLMDKGYVAGKPWTGMTYTEGSSGFDSFLGGGSGSVYIYSVDTAVAKLAGFEAGDMAFAVDDIQITSIDDLSSIITSHKVGDKLKFTIVRSGKTRDISLRLQEKKEKGNL